MPEPVTPVLGPLSTEKSTLAPWIGSPQLLVRVAVTLAVVLVKSVCDAGARLRSDPAHTVVPIGDHCVDSLPLTGGHDAASTPPVLITCAVSLYAVVVPSTLRSTSGITPDWLQLPAQPA